MLGLGGDVRLVGAGALAGDARGDGEERDLFRVDPVKGTPLKLTLDLDLQMAAERLLAELDFPEPWRSHVQASLELIDDLERRIGEIERWLRRSGADHRYIPLLMSAPGIGWVTGFTIAADGATLWSSRSRSTRALGTRTLPRICSVPSA